MPLALELAASRVAVLSPGAIARGLDDALALLPMRARRWTGATGCWTPRPSARCARSRSSAAAPRWSTRSSVCSLEALETLVAHSLLRAENDRFRLLETVRQYALERVEPAARDRHRDRFLELAERTREDVLSPRQPAAFAALDEEAANLAAAIEHALATDPAKALRFCLALDFWFRARARFARGRRRVRARAGGGRPATGAARPRAGRVGLDRGRLRRLHPRQRAGGRGRAQR